MRAHLTLADLKTEVPVKTVAIEEVVEAKPASDKKREAKRIDYAGLIREFEFPDGRKVAIHKHAVLFCTPLKDNPEKSTLVGVKGGDKPMPLNIAYVDFLGWWSVGGGTFNSSGIRSKEAS